MSQSEAMLTGACFRSGADPGFFLGGGAPLRNDVTDDEVKKKNQIRIHEEESFISGGGCAPPAPSP